MKEATPFGVASSFAYMASIFSECHSERSEESASAAPCPIEGGSLVVLGMARRASKGQR
jgi:hypothetical protein